MVDTNITVSNGALALLGESSITNFTDDDKSKKVGAIYTKYINSLLSMHPWRFARKKSGSLSATTAPDNAWTYAYSLPADFLTLVNAYNSGDASAQAMTGGYEIFGNTIVTNESSLYIDYTYTVDEDNWPDYFQNFVHHALAGVLALLVTDDEKKEAFFRQLAFGTPRENGEGGLYKVVKGVDSRQQPKFDLPTPSLLLARFS